MASGRTERRADDPFGGREPTSHERMTGKPWDASYADGPAPWDVGGPQPAVVRVAAGGGFAGSVLDCGMFHTCDADERPRYVSSLVSVTRPGGVLHLLCFRDGPGAGPHPVGEADLRGAFGPGAGWEVTTLASDRVLTRFHGDDGAPAWLATITRS